MTREEQIQQAEINYSDDTIFDGCDYIGQVAKQEAFIAGAKWADANLQFSKEKFIEKACEWLENNFVCFLQGTKIGIYSNQFVTVTEMVDNFKRTMEE